MNGRQSAGYLRLAAASFLMAAIGTAPPGAVAQEIPDHLQCYKVTDPTKIRGIVDIDSIQLGLKAGCRIGKARKYCVPVMTTVDADRTFINKQLVDLSPIGGQKLVDDYVCYTVKCPKDQPLPGDTEIEDKFASRKVSKFKTSELCVPAREVDPSGVLKGVVMDARGPVAGATVRVRATDNTTVTGPDGSFTLTSLTPDAEVEVTAWVDGHYIGRSVVTAPTSDVTITLRRHNTTDNPDYEWQSPIDGMERCGVCHPLILPQWTGNAHGGAVTNERFFSMYNGTDVSGTEGIGPGYRVDFPDEAGTCANCHAPAAVLDDYAYDNTDMNAVRGKVTAGIHCDYCHKVGGVDLDPETGSVYPDAPGVQSQVVFRPPAGDNIFFGPYDDVPDPDVYLPLISESAYCAPCHQYSMGGTPIFESYEEWLASPYARDGVTCQDCHMPPTGDTYFAWEGAGAYQHPPEKIPSHLQLGATDVGFLQDSVKMDVSAEQTSENIAVTVSVTNQGAGHHIPTDYPGRHMILVVTATDEEGRPVLQVDGPTVPDWGGPQAGLPGTAFAKILRDVATGEFPVLSYWKPTTIATDNRIPALATESSTYTFAVPTGSGTVQVAAKLLFRRIYQELADEKGWAVPDIVMAKKALFIQRWSNG